MYNPEKARIHTERSKHTSVESVSLLRTQVGRVLYVEGIKQLIGYYVLHRAPKP